MVGVGSFRSMRGEGGSSVVRDALPELLSFPQDFDKGTCCQYCTAVQKPDFAELARGFILALDAVLVGGTTKQSWRTTEVEIASLRSQ